MTYNSKNNVALMDQFQFFLFLQLIATVDQNMETILRDQTQVIIFIGYVLKIILLNGSCFSEKVKYVQQMAWF